MKQRDASQRLARIAPQTFAAVIHAYLASQKFNSLGKSTQSGFRTYLRIAEHPETLGAVPVVAMRPSLVQEFLDAFADRPGAQYVARSAIKAVEKWAIVRDLLPIPITLGTEIVGSEGGHEPWLDEQIETAEAFAHPDVSRIVTLGSNTGQRGSDLCRMRWDDIATHDGRMGINVTQQKTGVRVWIPFPLPLARKIITWERAHDVILTGRSGKPWRNRKQLAARWEWERDHNPRLAICGGLVLHGLRASSCIRLRRAGATTMQISDMIGLSVQMVEHYCRFADQRMNALAAVEHIDRSNREQTSTKIKAGSEGQ